MAPIRYYRPTSIEEAVELLDAGVPLGGGTELTPRRRWLDAVIDLRELGLDSLEVSVDRISAGSGVRLQQLVDTEGIPTALCLAAMQQEGWNLRNMATLGGVCMAANGRSPLLCTLLTLDAQLTLEPGQDVWSLGRFLEERSATSFKRLITHIQLAQPSELIYEQVARAPADLPIVCASLSRLSSAGGKGDGVRVVLGGFGQRPIRVPDAERALREARDANGAAEAARIAYRDAGDAWASSEYRSDVAGALVRRLAREAFEK